MRTNVILPDDLIAEIDKIAGARKRSKFLEEAARDRIESEKLMDAFEKARGILKNDPRFATRAKVRKYIRDFRRKNSYRF
ncbi:hypothetical protein HYU92_00880 [Candidatus Curtissbacteria bacterium]|nr:hypothetical protein [Candidatus Curtissbacteria bacterium]